MKPCFIKFGLLTVISLIYGGTSLLADSDCQIAEKSPKEFFSDSIIGDEQNFNPKPVRIYNDESQGRMVRSRTQYGVPAYANVNDNVHYLSARYTLLKSGRNGIHRLSPKCQRKFSREFTSQRKKRMKELRKEFKNKDCENVISNSNQSDSIPNQQVASCSKIDSELRTLYQMPYSDSGDSGSVQGMAVWHSDHDEPDAGSSTEPGEKTVKPRSNN